MRKNYFLFIALLISTLSFGQILINEFEPNPVGTDPANVSFEIKGTPNTSFSGYIIGIESDQGSGSGLIDYAESVSGTFDANGLLVVSIPDLENPSFTIALTSNFTGTVGTTDIDTNDDGTIEDISTLATIYDAIGSPDVTGDEVTLYGVELGGSDFIYTGDEPGLIFRDGSTNNWYAVNDPAGTDVYDISANPISASSFDTDPTTGNTFGAVNPIRTATAAIHRDDILGFSVFPNPVNGGKIWISTQSNANKHVKIFDILGKQVLSTNLSGKELNVSVLSKGIYILRVIEEGKTSTRKLVVK
ncbi:MAG: T9SS type A sorting domain-containing protein [Flavobacteriaceae bacterium]|nr:T9SS type A sorting domain-containing protein [Flavobacteriaceae bacterium]